MTYIGEGRLIVDGKPRPAAEVLKNHKDTTETAEFLCEVLSAARSWTNPARCACRTA